MISSREIFLGLVHVFKKIGSVTRVTWIQTLPALDQLARPLTSLQSSSTICPPEKESPRLNEEGIEVSLPHQSFLPEKEAVEVGQADFALSFSLASRPPLVWDYHLLIRYHSSAALLILTSPLGPSAHISISPFRTQTRRDSNCRGWPVFSEMHLLWLP